MRLFFIFLVAIFGVFFASCGGTETGNPDNSPQNSAPVACQADAKVCADNSTVTRDPDNNCEFRKCPGE